MRKIIIIMALLYTAFSTPLLACGTMKTWINAYHGKGVHGDKNKKMVLVGIYKCGRYHYKKQDDVAIFTVLKDALLNTHEWENIRDTGFADRHRAFSSKKNAKKLLKKIFMRYNFLQGAVEKEGYDEVYQLLGGSRCFTSKKTQLKVIVKTTANVRNSPNGKKIGYLKNGQIISCLAYEEDWVKISVPGKPRDDERIDIGYIHKRLVLPVQVTP